MKERTLHPALAGLCQVLAYGGKIENDRRVASEAVWNDHHPDSVSGAWPRPQPVWCERNGDDPPRATPGPARPMAAPNDHAALTLTLLETHMIIGGHALLGMDEINIQQLDTILGDGDGQSPPWGRGETDVVLIRLDLAAVPSGATEHVPSWSPRGKT